MGERVVIEIREPGKVPEMKRPYGDLAKYIRELMDVRPTAIMSVITVSDGYIDIADAGEFLHMLDGRQRHACRRHRRSWREAWRAYLIATATKTRAPSTS